MSEEKISGHKASDIETKVKAIENLARLMDSQFKLPGIPLRLGLDTIIGLIPGIGDSAGLAIAGYIVYQSRRLGVSRTIVFQMVFNIFVDWMIGLIPIIGDIFDWGWKGNNKNAALLRDYVNSNCDETISMGTADQNSNVS